MEMKYIVQTVRIMTGKNQCDRENNEWDGDWGITMGDSS